METMTLVNGNKQKYNIGMPKVVILGDRYNDVALAHIKENTGLSFNAEGINSMVAYPENSQQIVKLFLTYNFKTQYHNNNTNNNTLFLKSDHHQGFAVNSICFDCVKHNNIITNGLEQGDRLAC